MGRYPTLLGPDGRPCPILMSDKVRYLCGSKCDDRTRAYFRQDVEQRARQEAEWHAAREPQLAGLSREDRIAVLRAMHDELFHSPGRFLDGERERWSIMAQIEAEQAAGVAHLQAAE